ncbi:RNA recognition motif domain-containing protein [Flaviaesturariibacter aridisoli]|uniref:RNA-binding protein n=1 Tax=Flaviaesturariibacter aridisoli TaxID=2545761 RepID=A0A4R4E516_9BACT|nr:RNA-binding protein [Flaviaesturariibacter aridisoli]TCZ74077.1 RNA-binding protein [Flaviaesturariibacter aridisoli]
MRLVIYHLDAVVDQEALAAHFTSYGPVASAEIAQDAFTGLSRGFGYVELGDAEGQRAIEALNGSTWHGHSIVVEEAPEVRVQKGSYKVGNGAVWTPRTRRR